MFWILSFFILGIIIVHYRHYIYYTLLYSLCLTGLFYVILKTNLKNLQTAIKKRIFYIFTILFCFISFSLINVIHNRLTQDNNGTNISALDSFDNKIVELQNSNKKFLIVGEESESLLSKWATFRTFKNNSDLRLEGKLIPTGWFINTIQFDKIVKGSLINQLVEGDIWILGNDEMFFNNLKKFIYTHYYLKVEFTKIDSFKYSEIFSIKSDYSQ